MRIFNYASVLCLALCLTASAQNLNELYVSHSGSDDMEMVEIIGAAGSSLDDVLLCVVDSGGSTLGDLEIAIDLSGFAFPGDGYFVVGNTSPDTDFVPTEFTVATDSTLSNESTTYYLIQAADPAATAAILALLGTNVSPGGSSTILGSMGTILDSVTIFAPFDAATFVAFDGSPVVGPDGAFLPAGIFRDGDFPSPWCNRAFLDFDDVTNAALPRTPGAANTTCPAPLFPGNGADIAIDVAINGVFRSGLGDHLALAGSDFVQLTFVSPGGAESLDPFGAYLQVFPSAGVPTGIILPGEVNPSLIADLAEPFFVLANGFEPANPFIPLVDAFSIGFNIPSQLGGTGLSVVCSMFIENAPTPSTFGIADAQQLIITPFPPSMVNAWINELHYDNSGTDVNEGAEVAGDAGLDLTNWQLVPYNGNGGGMYSATTLSGIIPNESNGIGTLNFAISGLQNGAPDGIALVTDTGSVVEFISYEGSFMATDGPAAGLMSTDVGVSEPGSPVDDSLQRIGTGNTAGDFTWTGPVLHSRGTLNAGQTITP